MNDCFLNGGVGGVELNGNIVPHTKSMRLQNLSVFSTVVRTLMRSFIDKSKKIMTYCSFDCTWAYFKKCLFSIALKVEKE